MSAIETKDRDTALWETANRQFGLLRLGDLRSAGFGRNDVAHRVATRRLTRLHHRVFALGHTALRDEGYWLAALWACPGSALSLWSAAGYHRWSVKPPDGAVHVSTTAGARSRPSLTVHRVRHLGPLDVFTTGLFTVTTVPRTLIDLADHLDWPGFRELADRQRYLDLGLLRRAQQRTPKRPGAPLVTRLLEADDAHTKSEFERRFLRFVDAHELPRPDALNARVAGHRADCVYRTPRVVVELDGRAYHERRDQMRADRQRDFDYQVAGHRILRLLWDELHADEADATTRKIRRMLALS